MPELVKKAAADRTPKTTALMRRDPKKIMLANLQGQELAVQAKLERIKKWPEKDRDIAAARTEDTLNQIRERMSELESAK